MTPERCQIVFFTGSIILAVIVALIGGTIGWFVASVLALGAPAMFAYGCHRAAMRASEYAERKGARNALQRIRDRAMADLSSDSPSEAHPPHQ